jgi:peptide deformylase
MASIGIVQEGDPILREVAPPFDLPAEAEDARRVIAELHAAIRRADTIHNFAKGMGVAAPQVGIRRAAAVIRTPDGEYITLLNPQVIDESVESDNQYEGCWSFFDVRGRVRRPLSIEVEHQEVGGKKLITAFHRSTARLVIHEVDHLWGRLYKDWIEATDMIPVETYQQDGFALVPLVAGLTGSSPVFNAISFAVGLFGIYLAFRYRPRNPRLAYQYEALSVTRSDDLRRFDDRISISWDGRQVTDLSLTRIVFWNDGPKTVEGTQIVRTDPLTVSFSGPHQILIARIVRVTKSANAVHLDLEEQQVAVTFDYLERGDGVLIEILHTSMDATPRLSGQIRGIPAGARNRGVLPNAVDVSARNWLRRWTPERRRADIAGLTFEYNLPVAIFATVTAAWLVLFLSTLKYEYVSTRPGLITTTTYGTIMIFPVLLVALAFAMFIIVSVLLTPWSVYRGLRSVRRVFPRVLDPRVEAQNDGPSDA